MKNIIDVYEVTNSGDLDPDNTEEFIDSSFKTTTVNLRLEDACYVMRITAITPPTGHEINRLDHETNKVLIHNLIEALYGMLPPEQ